MSERYWITGAQLGLLTVNAGQCAKKILNNIIDTQFVDNIPFGQDPNSFDFIMQKKIEVLNTRRQPSSGVERGNFVKPRKRMVKKK